MEKEISHDTLYMFLKEKYNERVGDMVNLGYKGSIFTSLDGKKFTIIYDKSSMLLNTNNNSKEVIDELTPVLSEYMHAKPICSYDILYSGDELEDYILSVEWETVNPKRRLKLIINNEAYDNAETFNIKLHNGRNIYDYLEDKKMIIKKY